MEKLINNRYQVIRQIGAGGMADVFLATDPILDRLVALKIIRVDLASDPISLLRFQREAKAISKMDHANIVQVYDVGEYETRPYIVMEYVDGTTLKQLLKKRFIFPVTEALDIMKQLTSALIHAHNNDIIHRDIKPHNVLIKNDGTVKITDFGIAISHDTMQLTSSDTVLGSAHYLAPEIINGDNVSNLADIYALGIVFYELLTGDVPFNQGTPVQIAMAHINEEIPRVKEKNSTIPQSVENIIIKATAKEKTLRYQSAEELYHDLENALVKPDVKKIDLNSMQPKNKNSNKLLFICGGISLATLIIFTLILSLLFKPAVPIEKISIPNVLGKTKEEAIKILKNSNLTVSDTIEEVTSEVYNGGLVCGISPNLDEVVTSDTKIKLTLSKARQYTIPNFIGLNSSEVYKHFITNNILIKIKEEYVGSNEAAGTIVKQSLAANSTVELNNESTFEISVAIPEEKIYVPNVISLPIQEAKEKLEKLGFTVITKKAGNVEFQSLTPYSIISKENNAITIEGDL